MRALLSIKPEFARMIFIGVKKYEFRRSIFKRHVNKVIVYASSPSKNIIGEFKIDKILFDNVETLWKQTKGSAGIDKKYFRKYFRNKEKGYAIKISKYRKYRTPRYLEEFGVAPPQSFIYLK